MLTANEADRRKALRRELHDLLREQERSATLDQWIDETFAKRIFGDSPNRVRLTIEPARGLRPQARRRSWLRLQRRPIEIDGTDVNDVLQRGIEWLRAEAEG